MRGTRLGDTARVIAILFLALTLPLPAHAQTPQPAAGLGKVRPEDLTSARVNAAIKQAVKALYTFEPTYIFPPEYAYHGHNQGVRNMMGNHSLGIWALLAAGESYQNPPLYRRLNWVLSSDSAYIYDRGMRATMLEQLPRTRWAPWVRRDGLWLKGALTDKGNYNESWTGGQATGLGDNANGQYGVLGLWHLQTAGFTEFSGDTWKKIDTYWRDAQEKTEGEAAAGWAVNSLAGTGGKANAAAGPGGFYGRVSGPMTAGGVATLSLTERYLNAGQMESGKYIISANLRKGIRWLDEHYAINDKDEAADRYYYMWTVQRVGQATGYRTFNNVDWFRDVTAEILSEQQPNGTWNGDKGPMLSTGFALLYLSKANAPLSIAKVRFKSRSKEGRLNEASWNNRPHDIWNFAEYASDLYECTTTWQIAELNQPVYNLMESPILYVSTDQAFEMSEKEFENLREYIRSGGLLITNQESVGTGDAVKSFKDLSQRLFGREYEELKKDHPFEKVYDLHQNVPRGVQMRIVHNGIRPQMIHFVKDIGKGMQSNDPRAEGFSALSNIYLWVTGMNPRRARLESNYVPERVAKPQRSLLAARIKHAGNFDPEPVAMDQLRAILANDFGVDLQVSPVAPKDLGTHRIAFLSTMGDAALTEQEATDLRKWVESGGVLWIDAVGGGDAARKASLEAFGKIAPNVIAAPMIGDNPILAGQAATFRGGYDCRRVKYRNYTQQKSLPVATPRMLTLQNSERPLIVLATEDLMCGVAGLDHWGIWGYTPESARKLVVNGCLYALSLSPPEPGKSLVKVSDLATRRFEAEPSTPAVPTGDAATSQPAATQP